ncbi:MAG: PKD domain-containing protein, partial [bacterium]|nr:PKD domain-containing protein [bacterium]
MKMKKYIFITALLVLMFVSALVTHAIEVTLTGTLYVGDTVSFRPTSSAFGNVSQADWNFGDGATTSVTYGMDTVTHAYTSPGSYTVTVTGQYAAASPITETVTVLVYQGANNRYIEVTPDDPIVGQPSTFRAYNFNTPEGIVWDMGDGTILSTGKSKRSRSSSALARRTGFKTGRRMVSRPMGTDVVTHTYTTPGNYMVRAYDFHGDTKTPVILNVTARLPDRLITYSPAQPLAGAPVQFNAANFLSNQIDWNFGDGTTVSGGGISVTHVYNNAGTYSVTANEVNSNFAPVSIRVTVTMPNRQIIYSPQTSRV